MIAVAIAVVALVIAFVVPGPAGPAGATGPRGPAGPGSLVATNSTTQVPQQVLVSGCNNFVGADVSITVPGAGRVVVWATVRFSLSHTTGSTDLIWIFLKTSTSDCTLTDGTTTLRFNSAELTQVYFETTTVMDSFNATAGTHTYYVNAEMVLGSLDSSDFLESAYLVAVFYPT